MFTQRTERQWASMVPEVVMDGNDTQLLFCIKDAQRDIATLFSALAGARVAGDMASKIIRERDAEIERLTSRLSALPATTEDA